VVREQATETAMFALDLDGKWRGKRLRVR